jgi:lycopene cyclase domain-containing protein
VTYLQFHLVFIVPPLVLLAGAVMGARRRLPPRLSWALPAIALIALVWTTPWDNYLVWRGVWGYGAERVVATIGYVPIEEYMFIVLQPLLTGLLLCLLLARSSVRERTVPVSEDNTARAARAMGVAIYGALALAGVFAVIAGGRLTYAGLILVWAAPVLAAQWYFAARAIARHWRSALSATAIASLYLWVADRIAIGLGVWTIAPEWSTGVMLVGLPIEEALFFLLTNLLVVQGLLWMLDGAQRIRRLRRTGAARVHA